MSFWCFNIFGAEKFQQLICIKCDVHHVALYNDRNSGFLKLRREPSFWCFNRNRNIEFCV